MKSLGTILLIVLGQFLSVLCWGGEHPGELETNSPEIYYFKDVLVHQEKFQQFIAESVGVLNLETREDLKKIMDQSTKGLFIHSFISETPLILEFCYTLMRSPEAMASFLHLFLNRNKLFIFSLLMILSLVLSHYLGELKYRYYPLSRHRLSYFFFRFSVVNGLRFGCFWFLFSKNMTPVVSVFLVSLEEVRFHYPVVYKVISFISTLSVS